MPYCPQCALPVAPGDPQCPGCGTIFRVGGWQPVDAPTFGTHHSTVEPRLLVKPARWYRRLSALVLDLLLPMAALALLAQALPDGPPPADAMAFFSAQDFRNYFILVGTAIALTAVPFALVAHPKVRGTPGQYLLGLELCSLSGEPPTARQIAHRMLWSIVRILVIVVPGPVIALAAGLIASFVFRIPFSTNDKVLIEAGFSSMARYGIHGLSFLALAAAVWFFFIHPAITRHERVTKGLTALDRKTLSTHVRRE